MKTNIRSKSICCYTILNAPKSNSINPTYTDMVKVEVSHQTNVGISIDATHYETDPKTGFGCHTFGLFSTKKQTKHLMCSKPRFSQKNLDLVADACRKDIDSVEKVIEAELWNAFKTYAPQLDFDHEAGTVTIMNMEDAVLIGNGTSDEVVPANGTHWTLHECYKLLDCDTIEVVTLTDELILIIDEEGKCKPGHCLWNKEASALCKHYIKNWNDEIVGKAILCPSSMLK